MEVRRVSKYFYCHSCNNTFNRLIDPDEMHYGACPHCNKGFIEFIDRPRPAAPNLAPRNSIPEPQVRQEPYMIPNYQPQQPNIEPQQNYMPPHGYYCYQFRNPPQIPIPNYQPQGPPPIYRPWGRRGIRGVRGRHRSHERRMPRMGVCFFAPRLPFGHVGMPFGTGELQAEEEKMPFGIPNFFVRPLSFFRNFNFPSFFNNFHQHFFPAADLGAQEILRNFMSNYRARPAHAPEPMNAEEEEAKRPPTSAQVINSMRPFNFEERHANRSEDGKVEYPSCVICCSTISVGEQCLVLPCGHMFHSQCVKPWLSRSNTCPTCRYRLPSGRVEWSERGRGGLRGRRGYGRRGRRY